MLWLLKKEELEQIPPLPPPKRAPTARPPAPHAKSLCWQTSPSLPLPLMEE